MSVQEDILRLMLDGRIWTPTTLGIALGKTYSSASSYVRPHLMALLKDKFICKVTQTEGLYKLSQKGKKTEEGMPLIPEESLDTAALELDCRCSILSNTREEIVNIVLSDRKTGLRVASCELSFTALMRAIAGQTDQESSLSLCSVDALRKIGRQQPK